MIKWFDFYVMYNNFVQYKTALGKFPLDNCPRDNYPPTNSPRDNSPRENYSPC